MAPISLIERLSALATGGAAQGICYFLWEPTIGLPNHSPDQVRPRLSRLGYISAMDLDIIKSNVRIQRVACFCRLEVDWNIQTERFLNAESHQVLSDTTLLIHRVRD